MRHRPLAFALLAIALAGCGRSGVDVADRALAVLPEATTTFDINALLSDDDVRGGQAITQAEVQAFLDAKGSFLAGYTDPDFNQPAAQLIVEQSLAQGISPLYMLARIQTESSLVESGSSAHLDAATGCGCPDSGGCDASYAGFGKQIECGAKLMHNYFAALDAGQPTVAGWRVGKTKSTSDPCTVTPANEATAALYTYTPWVGAYGRGCGRSDVGGSSLVALIFTRYAGQQRWGGGPPNPCIGLVDGYYCGGDGLAGDAGTLYVCRGGQVASSEVCAAGCKWNPPGTPDACNPAPDGSGAPDAGGAPAPGDGRPGDGTPGAADAPGTAPATGMHGGCSVAATHGDGGAAGLALTLVLLGLARRCRACAARPR